MVCWMYPSLALSNSGYEHIYNSLCLYERFQVCNPLAFLSSLCPLYLPLLFHSFITCMY